MATLVAAGAAGSATAGAVATAATALSVVSMVRQGQAAEVSSKVQADKIKQDATAREVNRRKRLVSSLASQNATRAASGIAFFEGSSKDIALEDVRSGEGAIRAGTASAGYAADAAISQGRYARRGSVIGASASLLSGVQRYQDRG